MEFAMHTANSKETKFSPETWWTNTENAGCLNAQAALTSKSLHVHMMVSLGNESILAEFKTLFAETGYFEWVKPDNTKPYPECCGTKKKKF